MGESEKIWSISEVNGCVREIIENSLLPIWVGGEVGNLNIHRSGHVYMTLKDARTQIRAVFFGGADQARRMNLQAGMAVEAYGKLTVYEARGEYQISLKSIRPLGLGELQRKFEELKSKLASEGLFDQERKKTLPLLPGRIGVVTSPGGAAIRDFLQIINRRFPNINIKIYPAAVQGKGAEKKLAAGIEFFNRSCPVDVIVLTRGGGSLEDLWPFNEEVLARAVAVSGIPVISAVGHEIDFTISDFVADLRAPTPSAAAELVIGRQEEFSETLEYHKRRMRHSLELTYSKLSRRFEAAAKSYVFREPLHLLREKQQKLDELSRNMESSAVSLLDEHRRKLEELSRNLKDCSRNTRNQLNTRLEQLSGRLYAMSPAAVLQRGYAVITDPETGKVVRSPKVPAGKNLTALVAEGILNISAVDGKEIDFAKSGFPDLNAPTGKSG